MDIAADIENAGPIVDRALEIFFQGREGWFDPELDKGSREYSQAIGLLIDAGLFECRGCYDAKTPTEWLRIHCRRCGAVEAEYVNSCLLDALPFAGLADGGFANAATTIYRLTPHSVRRSGFGDWAIKAPEVASPDGETTVTPASLALLYSDCRPAGTFTIESHEFLQTTGGAVAVAAAQATATVGDITVNAIPDPELAKAIAMLASAMEGRNGRGEKATSQADEGAASGETNKRTPTVYEAQSLMLFELAREALVKDGQKATYKNAHELLCSIYSSPSGAEERGFPDRYSVPDTVTAFQRAVRRGKEADSATNKTAADTFGDMLGR